MIRVCGKCGHRELMPWDEWTGRMIEEPRCEECGTFVLDEHCEDMERDKVGAGLDIVVRELRERVAGSCEEYLQIGNNHDTEGEDE